MDTLIGASKTESAAGEAGAVKDVSTEEFATEVLDASFKQPVVVDFWAPWCGPCKQLGPVLEKAVAATGGAVRMVKMNIDANPEVAQQLRVQSIPAVFAFLDGRPIDAFVGAQPESQVKAFIERVAKTAGAEAAASPLDQAAEQAQAALEAGDAAAAGQIFAKILDHEPGHVAALIGLARCRIAEGWLDEAAALLDTLPEAARTGAAYDSARSSLDLAQTSRGRGELAALESRVAQNPGDHQARLDLANALYTAQRADEAIDALIESVRRDRSWNEEAARKQLLKMFEALGPTHPSTVSGRRKLSSVLFS